MYLYRSTLRPKYILFRYLDPYTFNPYRALILTLKGPLFPSLGTWTLGVVHLEAGVRIIPRPGPQRLGRSRKRRRLLCFRFGFRVLGFRVLGFRVLGFRV